MPREQQRCLCAQCWWSSGVPLKWEIRLKGQIWSFCCFYFWAVPRGYPGQCGAPVRRCLDCPRSAALPGSVISCLASGSCRSQSAARAPPCFKCFSHCSQLLTPVIPKFEFYWWGISEQKSLCSVYCKHSKKKKKSLINLTWFDSMSPGIPWCWWHQLNPCAILSTLTGHLLSWDSRGGSTPQLNLLFAGHSDWAGSNLDFGTSTWDS